MNEKWEQLIQCDVSKTATLQLITLAIGAAGTTTECSKDFLKIYDGPSSSSPPLFLSSISLCSVSSGSPLWFFGSSNQVYIRFTSDGTGTTGAGYAIKYSCSPKLDVSGGTMYDSGGVAGNYGNNENVYTPFECQVGAPKMTFTQLEVQGSSPACSTDSIKVYDAVNGATYGYTAALKSTYCGSISDSLLPTFTGAAAGTLLVVFTSDATLTQAGYTANYECFILTYTGPSGNLQYTSFSFRLF
jgi:hypothetical protein